MNTQRCVAKTLFLILIIAPSIVSAVVGNCGSANVRAFELMPGEVQITLIVKLNFFFPPPLSLLVASGFWINRGPPGYFGPPLDFGSLQTPGSNPRLAPRMYTDSWLVKTGRGRVFIEFPTITATGLFGFTCYGLVPSTEIDIGSDPISLEIPLNRKKADDLAFVIDTTGSMDDDIAAVRAAATSVVNKVAAESADFRVAVVQYNDPSASVVTGFTFDKSKIIGAINGLGASGGGDFPEHVYSGIVKALELPWRPVATHTIITMGDAPPKDLEPGTGYTRSKVFALANSFNIAIDTTPTTPMRAVSTGLRMPANTVTIPVPVKGYVPLYMVPIGNSPQTTSSFQALGSGSKGAVFPAASASAVVKALLNAITAGTTSSASGNKPTASLMLTSICWVTSKSHRMRVRNPNTFDVLYRWDVYRTSLAGSGRAPPGDSFFVVAGARRGSTTNVRLFWFGKNAALKSTTKATNQNSC